MENNEPRMVEVLFNLSIDVEKSDDCAEKMVLALEEAIKKIKLGYTSGYNPTWDLAKN